MQLYNRLPILTERGFVSYPRFPLFQSHIDLAHSYWERLVQEGDIVIDATCGNGHDSLKLAGLALAPSSGSLWALDIQEQAIKQTYQKLSSVLDAATMAQVHLLQQSHASFPKSLLNESVRLIVYNFGYLPGADKTITTKVESTLESINAGKDLIKPGGAISLTCYPGHPEGAREQECILENIRNWVPQIWNITEHRWLNRHHAPTLLILQRKF